MMVGEDAAKDLFEDGAAVELLVSAKKDVLCLTKVGNDDYRATKRLQE